MHDLIYGGSHYKEELSKLFPKAKITDASDDIHEGRISIETEDIEQEEYLRIITLNGFFDLSLTAQLWILTTDIDEIKRLFNKWNREYPAYFKSH